MALHFDRAPKMLIFWLPPAFLLGSEWYRALKRNSLNKLKKTTNPNLFFSDVQLLCHILKTSVYLQC